MTYGMTLDNSWEIMSEEEMYDVNGGVTISNSTLDGILIALGINPLGTVLYAIGAYKLGAMVAGAIAALPTPISWAIAAYVSMFLYDLGSGFITAVVHNKDLEIGFGWKWGVIPVLTFDAV
jgi:hypothetical protein